MKSRHLFVKYLVVGGLAQVLATSGVPIVAPSPLFQVQFKIPKSAFPKDLCLDCKTGPITIVGPTTPKPVKLQIDPHTGELFRVP